VLARINGRQGNVFCFYFTLNDNKAKCDIYCNGFVGLLLCLFGNTLVLDPILTINYSCLACILLGCLAVYEYLGHMSFKRYINALFCMTIFCIP